MIMTENARKIRRDLDARLAAARSAFADALGQAENQRDPRPALRRAANRLRVAAAELEQLTIGFDDGE